MTLIFKNDETFPMNWPSNIKHEKDILIIEKESILFLIKRYNFNIQNFNFHKLYFNTPSAYLTHFAFKKTSDLSFLYSKVSIDNIKNLIKRKHHSFITLGLWRSKAQPYKHRAITYIVY